MAAKFAAMKFTTYERSTNVIISRLNTIKTAVNVLASTEVPLSQVQLRTLANYLTEIKKKRGDFENNLNRVLEHQTVEEIPEGKLAADADLVNDSFVQISSIIETLLPPDQPLTPSSVQPEAAPVTSANQVRLPKLELRHFDGNPTQWVSFINLFDTAVHRNPNISNVAKMQYLLSALSGEPLTLIQSLSLTPANYLIAYDLLRERYHNLRRLTTLHLNQIIDLPTIDHSTPQSLRTFVNMFFEHTEALKALECEVSSDTNSLLSALLLRKLDNELRRKLEEYRSRLREEPHTLPTAKCIVTFLNEECSHNEDANLHQTRSKTNYSHTSHTKASPGPARFSGTKGDSHSRKVSLMSTQGKPTSSLSPPHPCFACKQVGHKIYSCPSFKGKTPQERYTLVKEQQRCISCLGAHEVKQCSSKSTCLTCHKRHHTLLHFNNHNKSPSAQVNSQEPNKELLSASAHSAPSRNSHHHSTVLLGTTLVVLTSSQGTTQVFRALIDSGSMCDFISERATQLLGNARQHSMHTISGISQNTIQTKGCVDLKLSNLSGHCIASQQRFLILDKISVDLPRTRLAPEVLRRVRPYTLADPSFHLPGGIDVLLGGALLPQIFTNESYSLGPNMPHVVGTFFGFVVMGSAPCAMDSSLLTHSTALITTTDHDLHSSLQKFWHQEEPPVHNKRTMEEELCDEHFSNTVSRTAKGRYVIRLPFKDIPVLGDSRIMADRRFRSLEKKFRSQNNFHLLYTQFMTEYRDLGHMEKFHDFNETSTHFFLPHHGVLKGSSSTTKLRTVFDASAKTSNGLSLNDQLLTGRKLQTNICDILLHFRTHNVVFSCDIRQMYRQIKVHPDDQVYQLILWRDKPTQEIAIYKLTTVTYGMNCSPYLAIKTLCQLADDEGQDFPKAAQVLKNETYVDDIITGAENVEDAQELQEQLIGLLGRGGFELRKWSSNSSRLLQALPMEHLESPVFLEDAQHPHVSILGLYWCPVSDDFTYKFNLPQTTPTKRTVLSIIARIYDPCGFLAPYTMLAKCFMQLLWASGLNWDDPLPLELAEKWQTFISDSKALSTFRIPRSFQLSPTTSVELHGFSDASEQGYAAVLYFRCQLANNETIVRQIMAKTRVAPLKRISVPRLELCGAHLLAQLTAHCITIFSKNVTFANTYLWCDSSVVLSWLQIPSYRLKTYVANRVSQIQELIPSSCWHHVRSHQNPADCASRGMTASYLQHHTLWWNGPEWLLLSQTNWPTFESTPNDNIVSEEIKAIPLTVLTITPQVEWDLLSKFSSWTKLQYVMAYVLRFTYNCRHQNKIHGVISTQELDSSQLQIVKLVQNSAFSEDKRRLSAHKECTTKLHRLTPFLDSQDVLRVGGRLRKAPFPKDALHPILLPKRHHVTEIVIDYYHKLHCHSGPQLTQALICQKFWILCARGIIRSRIFKCVTCFKVKPRNKAPLMGDLPASRVTPARPFSVTGTDFCGPFMVKVHNLRAIRHTKVYICVFVCLVTKAVHLEVVTDLTTEAFIATLTRFVSRRGLCSDVYCDCGTNFVGADKALRKIIDTTIYSEKSQEKIHHFATPQRITFHFNPPAAPHQGGIWESAVKSAKHHLHRVMGETVLTLIDFVTLTTQIEAMLNSRPLTPLSSDPADLLALTPGHFLIGEQLTSIPQPNFKDLPTNRLKQWQLVQAIYQRVWHRWQLEYLHNLMQRSKWTRPTKNLQVGDLVLVHSPSPPLSWPLARITAVHPGRDGIVRVVDLKTARTTLTRPAVKVFPLPID